MKKDSEEEFLTSLKDLVKQKTNTEKNMIQRKKVNTSELLMQIMHVVGQWPNTYLMVSLSGYKIFIILT